ncbi:MAG: O-antigen ligase family protein, partial [Myxococcales bacterium]
MLGAQRAAVGRDGVAFASALLFAVTAYTGIVNLFPSLEVIRPAMLTAVLAVSTLLLGRIASGLPISWDGARGLGLIGFTLVALASVAWSFDPASTRRESVELFKLCAIYVVLINVVNTPKRLALICGATVLAALVPAIATLDRWANDVDLLEGYRARWLGVYGDPNHLAMALVAIVPIAATFCFFSKSWLMRAASAVVVGTSVAVVVLTHSRGGALGLALALALWAITGRNKVRTMFGFVLVLIAVGVFAPSSFWNRTETIADYEQDASAMGRVYAWEVASELNQDRPLLGGGAGAFMAAWPQYARYEARGTAYVAHNVFLAVLAELGWIGFGLFLLFVGKAMGGAMEAIRDPEVGQLARGAGEDDVTLDADHAAVGEAHQGSVVLV